MRIENPSQVQIDATIHKAAKAFTSANGLVLKVFISNAVREALVRQGAIAG